MFVFYTNVLVLGLWKRGRSACSRRRDWRLWIPLCWPKIKWGRPRKRRSSWGIESWLRLKPKFTGVYSFYYYLRYFVRYKLLEFFVWKVSFYIFCCLRSIIFFAWKIYIFFRFLLHEKLLKVFCWFIFWLIFRFFCLKSFVLDFCCLKKLHFFVCIYKWGVFNFASLSNIHNATKT